MARRVDPTERTELVTGPSRLTRNPIFSAMIVTAADLAGMVPSVIVLAGFALLVAGLQLQVPLMEEPYLRRVHGQGYLAHAAEVGWFLPGVGRLPASQPTRSTR